MPEAAVTLLPSLMLLANLGWSIISPAQALTARANRFQYPFCCDTGAPMRVVINEVVLRDVMQQLLVDKRWSVREMA